MLLICLFYEVEVKRVKRVLIEAGLSSEYRDCYFFAKYREKVIDTKNSFIFIIDIMGKWHYSDVGRTYGGGTVRGRKTLKAKIEYSQKNIIILWPAQQYVTSSPKYTKPMLVRFVIKQ